ncbi:MAG: VWA domain-containing protein [Planctomycetia bacterium]|nr:VWA domain-containing protein [Planctomycetia bacterium]
MKLTYTQLLTADGGLVEYRYPLATEKFSAKPLESVSVTVRLEADAPLTTIHSPSHEVEVRRDGDRKAVIGFEAKDLRPDTDFLLAWGVEPADEIGLGLLSHREAGDHEGTFALFAAPSPAALAAAPQPKDIVFVLDTSGSMAEGDKLGQARRALEFCLRNLDDRDRFGVVRFATEAEALTNRLLPADGASREQAVAFVKGFKPIGGTAIADALTRGLKLATTDHDPDRPCFVVFLTDGLPTGPERTSNSSSRPSTARSPAPCSRTWNSRSRATCGSRRSTPRRCRTSSRGSSSSCSVALRARAAPRSRSRAPWRGSSGGSRSRSRSPRWTTAATSCPGCGRPAGSGSCSTRSGSTVRAMKCGMKRPRSPANTGS